ncbi:S8 family serine peptidase [Actinopolymorpha alba]|uniref:S8 family serine peptidase n=1 Tax=Actinopolymorpha alba TaxID=533267 RepID=UPI000381F194|nr:S8 family serine peptidase [Actinopolymorpha alba]
MDKVRLRAVRSLVGGVAAAALLVGMGPITTATATATTHTGRTSTPDPKDKIKPKLEQRLAADRPANFWVRFTATADLSRASAIKDWNARGTAVAKALRDVAQTSQRDVIATLKDEGVDYQAFWATNAVYVRQGSLELAERLAAEAEVQALYPTTAYAVPKPVNGKDVNEVDDVEWGIANINADDAWSQYDVRGEDIVVANIDTGVQYDHPALVNQYRGNKGDGTFDHNYNWFDAAGVCGDAPCDSYGHGTHTMGTMAGDGGSGNRIGVAPHVKWIAANGCCPSDAALIASGQWMLEPTDLAGENPDVSKRPHIINNSWGSQVPSNDPFMEDVTDAWTASGIFSSWSNGNNAPGCLTSGSPGSRTANYSVGAYDNTNTIASFSSRGAGQDREIKPNIAAPGVNVRSAVPGSGYQSYNGTSMAAPHVAGTVALLWSAAPTLVGDVAGTRALLDRTAADHPDDECGGTDADNNVYGEGQLNALALLDAAPVAETGTLGTTVKDGGTGDPIAGAKVSVTGPVNRERTTSADGRLSLPLPVGTYTVTVSSFGYADETVSVEVTSGGTTSRTIGLRATPRVTVTGRITDGSGQGWPLYAKLTVAGMPGGTFMTAPATGRYSLSLPAGATYTLTIDPDYPGYETVTDKVTVGSTSVTHDIAVPVDAQACTAPGYHYTYDGAFADFTTGLPAGWSVVDNNGSGEVWRFDDPYDRGNRTGGDGAFAIAQSSGHATLDSTLSTPVVDLRGQRAPEIRFRQDFYPLVGVSEVDLSTDGGKTWENVLRQTTSARGPVEKAIAIPQAADQPDVRVRFRYSNAQYNSRFWQLDDIVVGTRYCSPKPGGLVLGHVRDRNTGDPVNGATISSKERPLETAESRATPDDPNLPDGFFWMYSSLTGKREFTAVADSYQTHTLKVAVVDGGAAQPAFRLPAGRLSVKPADIVATVRSGRTTTGTFVVTNTGSAPAKVEFSEGAGGRVPLAASRTPGSGGKASTAAGSATGDGPEVVRLKGDFTPLPFARAKSATRAAGSGPAAGPWIDLANYPTRIMDNLVSELDGRIYSVGGVDGIDVTAKGFRYDPATRAWTEIAPLPQGRENPAGAFIDGILYVTGGWEPGPRSLKTTIAYDPATDTWTSRASAPVATAGAGRAVLDGKLYVIGGCTNACDGQDVQRYDPATDTWELLAEYPNPAGHLACAGIDGKILCAGGVRRGGTVWKNTYAYDPAANTWTRRADLPLPIYGSASTASYGQLHVSGGTTGEVITNEGFSYEPDTDTWSGLPPARTIAYRGGSACGLYRVGGSVASGFVPTVAAEVLPTYGNCAPVDLAWLSLDTTSVTLGPGKQVRVRVRLDAGDTSPGAHRGGVWIKEDTPYLVEPVNVTMTVAPR